jgi:hypothetical protein
MLFRVPKLLINIAHLPKLNRAEFGAIELSFLEQAARLACLIAGAARQRLCRALIVAGFVRGV